MPSFSVQSQDFGEMGPAHCEAGVSSEGFFGAHPGGKERHFNLTQEIPRGLCSSNYSSWLNFG